MYVKVVQLRVSHHVGNDGNFLLGVFDQSSGLDHAVGGEVLRKLDSGVFQKNPADVFAAHIENFCDIGQRLGASVVALDNENDFVCNFGKVAVVHL